MNTVLIFGGSPNALAALGSTRRMGDGEVHLTLRGEAVPRRDVAVIYEHEVDRALRRLSARACDVIVVDGRALRGTVSESDAARLLERLFPKHEAGVAARRLRTVVLVDATAEGARLAFLAGTHRVASVMVAPSDAEAVEAALRLASSEDTGKIAVCLAGGGIEGLLYEVGVLRAIDSFLDDRKLVDLDLFYGISAGAFLGALLANGLSPREIADGLRSGTKRLDRMTRRDIFDPNVSELLARAWGFCRDMVGVGEARNPISALYRAIPTAAFAGDALRNYLGRQLNKPSMCDRFDDLRRPLYIGATDQDTNEAVVFGEPGWQDVPVHQAVRASCALAPFFRPEKVAGRYYVDGAFTRTTNMRVAVKHGASLVLICDPLVPISSEIAGYVYKRGGLFGTMQGLKCLINGRFDKAVGAIQEMYPDVSFHLFRPEDDEMRILSGSPMKFLYREEIEELAYQRTLRKIRAALPEISRDMARHGVTFREPRSSVVPQSPFEEGIVAA